MKSDRQIRLAQPAEGPWLLELERLAGRRFADAGLPPDLGGLDPAVLAAAIADHRVWVACEPADPSAVGFVMIERYPDTLHLRELDVAPAHMRRGHGRALVEQVCAAGGLRRWPRVAMSRPLA